jgi:hypothetical protein
MKKKTVWNKKTMNWFSKEVDVWIEKYHLTDWIVTIEYSDTECKDCDVE